MAEADSKCSSGDVSEEEQACSKSADHDDCSVVSTHTSGCDPVVQPDPTLGRLAVSMFSALEEYLQSELQMTMEDYNLLTEMNRRTRDKYAAMSALGQQVNTCLTELNAKYAALAPCLSQLDAIETSLTQLETVTARLDAYSREIEGRVKSLAVR